MDSFVFSKQRLQQISICAENEPLIKTVPEVFVTRQFTSTLSSVKSVLSLSLKHSLNQALSSEKMKLCPSSGIRNTLIFKELAIKSLLSFKNFALLIIGGVNYKFLLLSSIICLFQCRIKQAILNWQKIKVL